MRSRTDKIGAGSPFLAGLLTPWPMDSKRGRKFLVTLCTAMIAVLVAATVRAAPIGNAPTEIGSAQVLVTPPDASKRPMSQLERRLQPSEWPKTQALRERYWLEKAKIIEGSNPLEDVRKDVEGGAIGIMARMNTGFPELRAPGLRCFDSEAMRSHTIFIMYHGDAIQFSQGIHLDNYNTYAILYNKAIVNCGYIYNIKCQIE